MGPKKEGKKALGAQSAACPMCRKSFLDEVYLERHLLAAHREQLELEEEGAPYVEEMDMLGFPWEEPSRNMQQQEQAPPHAAIWYTSSKLEDGHAGEFSPSPGRMSNWAGHAHSCSSATTALGASPGRQQASDSFGKALSGRWSSRQTSMAHELNSQRTAREAARESARQSVRESVSRRGALSQRAREQGRQREYLYRAPAAEIAEHNALHTKFHVDRQKQAYWTQHIDWDALDSKRSASGGGIGNEYSRPNTEWPVAQSLARAGVQSAQVLTDEHHQVQPHRLPPPQKTLVDGVPAQTSSATGSERGREASTEHRPLPTAQQPMAVKVSQRQSQDGSWPAATWAASSPPRSKAAVALRTASRPATSKAPAEESARGSEQASVAGRTAKSPARPKQPSAAAASASLLADSQDLPTEMALEAASEEDPAAGAAHSGRRLSAHEMAPFKRKQMRKHASGPPVPNICAALCDSVGACMGAWYVTLTPG